MKLIKTISLLIVLNYLTLLVIGWAIQNFSLSEVLNTKVAVFTLCSILLYLPGLVSYGLRRGLKTLPLITMLILTEVFLLFVLSYRSSKLNSVMQSNTSFTGFSWEQWEVQPGIRPGDTTSRLVACRLSDKYSCFSYSYKNYMIYRPYQLCNIKGELIYKDMNSIRTTDLLKNTYLEGRVQLYDCKETILSEMFGFRDRVIERIEGTIFRPQSSLLIGIIFGIDQYFSKSFEKSIQGAGISHIVAASGYNVSILVLGLDSLVKYLPKKLGNWVKVVCIWGYALLTGFSSSMVRASTMSSIGYILDSFEIDVKSEDSFLIAVALLVLINPLIAFDLGFLLSVSATFGVVVLSPMLEKVIKYKWFPVTTFACTVVTLPFTIVSFNTVSPYSIFANILILPVIESVMILGLVGLFIPAVMYIPWAILKYVEIIANWIGNLPYSIVLIDEKVSIVIFFLIILSLFILLKKYESKNSYNIS